MKKSFLAFMLIVQLPCPVFAQQPTPPPATPGAEPQKPEAPPQPARQSDDDDVVRITTNLVQVDAVVTDNNGKLVTDLRPEEVEISEDGRQQKITNFSFVSLDSIERPENKPLDKNLPPIPSARLRPEQVRRTIALSLKINRPGKYNTRMRNGFYGITDEEAVPVRGTPAQQLLGALASPFNSAGVHLRLTSLFANDQRVGSVVRSLLHVRARDLTFKAEPEGWFKAEFEVIAVTYGDNGVVVDQISKTQRLRAKGKTYERIIKDGFVYTLTVPVKTPGAYQLRTALRDEESARIGSANQFVEVPDIKKNRLLVSGIVVRGMSPEAYQKGESGLVNPELSSEDQTDEADPTASAAVRQFSRGQVMQYAFYIYNSQVDKASGKPNLKSLVRLFRNGEQIFAGNELPVNSQNQPDLKRLASAGAVQLGTEMLPGEYVLQIVVTDLLAKEKRRVASQWVDFEIMK